MDRLELISSKYGQEISKNLQMGFFGVYADASEIPHGTFYGSMILLGGAKPGGGPKNPREMETHLRKTLSHILLMTFISLNSLIKVLAAELNNQELEKKSKEILNSLFKEKWES